MGATSPTAKQAWPLLTEHGCGAPAIASTRHGRGRPLAALEARIARDNWTSMQMTEHPEVEDPGRRAPNPVPTGVDPSPATQQWEEQGEAEEGEGGGRKGAVDGCLF